MPFLPQSDDYSSEKIITEFKSIECVEEQLKYVLLHLYSLDKNGQERFRDQIIEYEKYLSNTKFMRQIRYRDAIIRDYSAEYFGQDYGDDDPFIYDEKLEMQINRINMRLLATIGLIAKSMKETNFAVDDET